MFPLAQPSLLATGAMVLLLTACGPRSVSVELYGDEVLNSRATGAPNVVLVRVYTLTRADAFREAPIEAFWEDDAEFLGDDLVRRSEVMLTPGGVREIEVTVEDGVRYVGAAADFYEADGDGWTAAVPVAGRRVVRIRVSAGSLEVVER